MAGTVTNRPYYRRMYMHCIMYSPPSLNSPLSKY
jgi:hypothetical protein